MKQLDIRRWKGCWPTLRLPDGRTVAVSTPRHFGRKRYWLLCPQCGRRCAILHHRACRICAKSRYASEFMMAPAHPHRVSATRCEQSSPGPASGR